MLLCVPVSWEALTQKQPGHSSSQWILDPKDVDGTVLYTRYSVSIVDTDALVLKHRGISSHNADKHLIISQLLKS